MQSPSLDYLLKKAGSKYELAVASAKRARKLVEDGKVPKDTGRKAVTIALEEIAQGNLKVVSATKKEVF